MEGNYLNRHGVVSGMNTDHPVLPEVELWTEVILQAIDDLYRHTKFSSRSDQRSAKEWLASDHDELGSFVWACQAINVDPNLIRSRLAKKLQTKNLGAVVIRSRAQSSVKSLPEAFQTFAGESRSRLNRSQDSKRAVA